MGIENVHPVLIPVNGKYVRLMNISFEKDQSIYFSFPLNRGYSVSKGSAESYSQFDRKRHRYLLDLGYCFDSFKVSFHPLNYTAHVKSNSGDYILSNYKLHNFGDNECFVCPMLQVIFPNNLSFLDEYQKTKYNHPISINTAEQKSDLCLFVFVHHQDVMINPDALDLLIPNRDKSKKVLYSFKIASTALYTCSIFVVDGEYNSESVILALNTEDKFVLFDCKPNIK